VTVAEDSTGSREARTLPQVRISLTRRVRGPPTSSRRGRFADIPDSGWAGAAQATEGEDDGRPSSAHERHRRLELTFCTTPNR